MPSKNINTPSLVNDKQKRPLCVYCNTRIRSFPVNFDWKNRRFHKKCYKESLGGYIIINNDNNKPVVNIREFFGKPLR